MGMKVKRNIRGRVPSNVLKSGCRERGRPRRTSVTISSPCAGNSCTWNRSPRHPKAMFGACDWVSHKQVITVAIYVSMVRVVRGEVKAAFARLQYSLVCERLRKLEPRKSKGGRLARVHNTMFFAILPSAVIVGVQEFRNCLRILICHWLARKDYLY